MEQMDLPRVIARIQRMEFCFDALREAEKPDPALLGELLAYYDGGQWLRDHELDEQGLLPPELKRGVLSEDGVFNLLARIASETD